jgi:hypothetical protein
LPYLLYLDADVVVDVSTADMPVVAISFDASLNILAAFIPSLDSSSLLDLCHPMVMNTFYRQGLYIIQYKQKYVQ